MNLRGIVRGAINQVNPNQQITWFQCTGTAGPDASGVVTPSYAAAQTVWAQVQPVPTDRLAHLDNLEIQGVLRSVYLMGAVASAVREDGTGGDLLQFPEIAGQAARTWIVELVDEQWNSDGAPQWCRVIARLQNDPNP